MERYSDIISSVKERVTNPFLISLLTAFSLHNWKIVVALFWWDNQQLYTTGNLNIYEFIGKEIAKEGSIATPFCYALGYTLFAQFFFGLFNVVGALWIKLTNKSIFWVSEDSPVQFSLYMDLKKNYDKSIKAYTKLVTEHTSTESLFKQTKNELDDTNKRFADAGILNAKMISDLEKDFQKKMDDLNKSNLGTIAELKNQIDLREKESKIERDPSIINGDWYILQLKKYVQIVDRRFIVDNQPDAINNFYYDIKNDQMQFNVTNVNKVPNQPISTFYYLKRITPDKLDGYQDGTEVTLVKRTPPGKRS